MGNANARDARKYMKKTPVATRKKLGISFWTLRMVFECVGYLVLVKWSKLNKRYYLKFLPTVLPFCNVFEYKGLLLNSHKDSIKIFDKTGYKWKDLKVLEKG